jgi:outer membrane receptor for ferrienterochelin and colicin
VKNENSGHYEEALINYTNALAEAKKFRFHNDFRNKVRARLKVLQTIIAYQKNSCQPVSCETNQL